MLEQILTAATASLREVKLYPLYRCPWHDWVEPESERWLVDMLSTWELSKLTIGGISYPVREEQYAELI